MHSGDIPGTSFRGGGAQFPLAVYSVTSNHPLRQEAFGGTYWGKDKEGDFPRAVRTPCPAAPSPVLRSSVPFAAKELTRLQEENETLKEEVTRLRGPG